MTEPIDFTKLGIVTITHARPKSAQETVEDVIRSIPDFRTYYLIGNHPTDEIQVGNWFRNRDPRCQFISTGRPPEHQGRLAESWNLGMQWAFRDKQVKWLWCLHDDLKIVPGWVDLCNNHHAELYVAPFGDMSFLFSRKVFEEVGWFDERYNGIGYQDNDWFTRVGWKMSPAKIVMENEGTFPGGAAITWVVENRIGLKNHWLSKECYKDRKAIGFEWYQRRWSQTWLDGRLDWVRGIQRGPTIPDIEWYPWFNRHKENTHD